MNNPPTRPKAKPPPYPRPVPLVIAEEIPPADEDVAWYAENGGDGSGEKFGSPMGEQRAAKRRRIEACAQAYLRGDQLYIMSSRLRGPFNSGWKNPWATKKTRDGKGTVTDSKSLEIPETGKKTFTATSEGRAEKDVTQNVQSRSSPPQIRSPKFKDIVPRNPPSPFVGAVSKLIESPIQPGTKIPTQAKETRVKEWLRTNQAFSENKSEVQVHSSPTPAAKRGITPEQDIDAVAAPRTSQSEPIAEPNHSTPHHDRAASERVGRVGKISSAVRQVQQLSRDMQSVMAEPVVSHATELQEEVGRLVARASKNTDDVARAEFAILRARRNPVQTESVETHMSPFNADKVVAKENQRSKQNMSHDVPRTEPLIFAVPSAKMTETFEIPVSSQNGLPDGEPQTQSKILDSFAHVPGDDSNYQLIGLDARNARDQDGRTGVQEANHIIAQSHMKDIEEPEVAVDTSRPNFATAASDLSTTTILPSAQPRLEPQLSVSSVTRDERLHSIKQVSGTIGEAPDDGNAQPAEKSDLQHGMQQAAEMTSKDRRDGLVLAEEATPPKKLREPVHLAAQHSEPRETSTVKKPKTSIAKDISTSVKGKSDTKRKKTSFVVDQSSLSSHGSIQEVMKAKISKNMGGPNVIHFGKDNLDIEVSDDDGGSVRKRAKVSSNNARPKSILKSINPSCSPSYTREAEKGIGIASDIAVGRSGNIPLASGQNAAEGEQFDLEAVIDDLGSFLGTWDAEKEAANLEIEL